ncbi:MAG: OmpA family protein [Pararhodobacter sp.]|nr:OmpA family protein [Pararhodobacter sp.]
MPITRRFMLVGLGVAPIAACDTERSLDRLDGRAGFGDASEHNRLVHTGQRHYVIRLGERFAAEVPTTINFAFDSARLDGEARAILDRQAAWIRRFPEATFRVYGHTDLVGSPRYNYQLGMRRARAAVNYLISRGVNRSRLSAVVSHGETQPLIHTRDRERQNRRTVTEVSGFYQRHPTVMNGQYAEVIYREFVESATWERPATYR